MKRLCSLFLFVTLASLLIIGLSPNWAYASVNDFNFSSFKADYYLSKDSNGHSTMKVVEKLTAEFVNNNQNHGIERVIPRYYDGHLVGFRFESMQRNGLTEPIFEQRQESQFTVISTKRNDYVNGTQEYTFTYTLTDVTKDFGNHQELYWDTNGTGWSQSFGLVHAAVHLDKSILKDFTGSVSCYEGVEGSKKKCSRLSNDDSVLFSSTGKLNAGENLTFDLSFKTGTFINYQMTFFDYVPYVLAALSLCLFVLMIFIKLKYGRNYPGKGTIIAEYTPPENISILLAADISDNSARSATAQLLDLAVRKKIRIIESDNNSFGIFKSKEYSLELVNVDHLDSDESSLIRIFFGGLVVGAKYTLKRQDTSKAIALSALFLTVGKKSQDNGYRKNQKGITIIQSLMLLGVYGCLIFAYTSGGGGINGIMAFMEFVLFIVSILSITFFKLLLLKPLTQKGRTVYDYLQGLKLYIKMAEVDRLKFLQSPDGALKESIDINDSSQLVVLYERLLPYAVLFGQEKEWLKQLGKYYEVNNASPYWYSGNGSFNAAVFASSVSSFSSYANSGSFSSSSGAGGGGSSGGGGGGGGGGGV